MLAQIRSLKILKVALLSLLMGLQLACSTQWREFDGEMDGDEVMSYLDEVMGFSQTSPQARSEVQALRQDPRSTIFFSQSTAEFGPAVSVASLLELTPLGVDRSPVERSSADLRAVQVFFLDLPLEGGSHRNALVVEMWWSETQAQQVVLTGEGSVVDGKEYVAFLGPVGSSSTSLVLRSFDVDRRGDLNSVIQLRVGCFEPETGIERYCGKFSALVGFQ